MKKVVTVLLIQFLFVLATHAQQPLVRRVTRGVTSISFDEKALSAAGLGLPSVRSSDASPPGVSQFIVRGKSNLYAIISADGSISQARGKLIHAGSFVLSVGPNVLRAREFQIVDAAGDQSLLVMAGNLPLFRVAKTQFHFAADTGLLALGPSPLIMTSEAAKALGIPGAAGTQAGTIEMALATSGSDQATFGSLPAVMGPVVPGPPLILASDLTFCSLDDLRQLGRVGDVVALSASTTSWNIGAQKLDWWKSPDWRHPYIVLNMYRIRDDRFEQIGQSWVKHGFFALSESECDTQCSEETDGTQLAPGCTDTYPTETNAFQGVLGPRLEIDPWDGVWTDTGFHPAGHTHDAVEHRLQVRDADLDPASNPDTQYFLEGYYVHYQDTDVMNSGAWKPVKIGGGTAGGIWRFIMTGTNIRPNLGFAIDAWTGARQTVIAEEVPPIKFHSNDGRAILAAKATSLGGGKWRYVYALLNIDMDRQISSLEIPVPASANVTQVLFHATSHHGEPVNAPGGTAIDNAPWSVAVGVTSVKWTTTTNPLRWGTVHSFSFVVDRSPGEVMATITPFRGTGPATLTGLTTGPAQ